MALRYLSEIPDDVQRVLIRLDLNMTLQDYQLLDDTRLVRSIPTIQYLLDRHMKVIVLSHFGRPKGVELSSSLIPIGLQFRRYFTCPILFATDCQGNSARLAIEEACPGSIILLENVRFHPEEEGGGLSFAQELASLAQVYVNDAFSVSHRAHASVSGIPHYLPAYAGLALEAELKALESVLNSPQKPVVAIVGGSKISTKLDLLKNLVTKVDCLVPGGGMANTFLAAQGISVGNSLKEEGLFEAARDILRLADQNHCKILLPHDVCVAKNLTDQTPRVINLESMGEDDCIYDVGPKTIEEIKQVIKNCRTVLWNGPLGVYEVPPYDTSSRQLADLMAELTKAGSLISVAGGGDTLAALNRAGHAESLTYSSTAGGAFLEWLEGKTLPGVKALD